MALETTLRPAPPYSLAASVRMRSDATRVWRDGVLTLVYERAGRPACARVWQRNDGFLGVRLESAEPDAALEHLRFMLAVDDDHAPFLRRFADDALLGPLLRANRGLRPLRSATVSHALLKAVCGQLIQAKAARLLEAKLLRLAAPMHAGLHLPPTRETFASFSVARLEAHGLVARKANVLVRLSRQVDLERLRSAPSVAVASLLERERGLGPWSSGMVGLHGLGRFDLALVGDLGLIKLCGELLGRRAEPEDTARLLAPYGEWAGLASVYLLAGWGRAYGSGLRRVRPAALAG